MALLQNNGVFHISVFIDYVWNKSSSDAEYIQKLHRGRWNIRDCIFPLSTLSKKKRTKLHYHMKLSREVLNKEF